MEFTDVESIKKHAIEHTKLMEQKYSSQISESIAKTIIYGVNATQPIKHETLDSPHIEIVNEGSIHAILSRDISEKVAVLDFASYVYPGEKYALGELSQELYLFHHSFLYEVLTMFVNSYYDYNKDHKNNSLYLDRALYVPNVIFEDDYCKRCCDVIVCTAPNVKIASKYYEITTTQNHRTLKNRIEFIKNIAESNKIDTLILGSWGTGKFGQNVAEVAYLFKQIFKYSSIKKIIYALPDVNNFELFKEIIM